MRRKWNTIFIEEEDDDKKERTKRNCVIDDNLNDSIPYSDKRVRDGARKMKRRNQTL